MSRGMYGAAAILGCLCATAAVGGQRAPTTAVATCLHRGGESDVDRLRRDRALALARAINEAQGTTAERIRLYVPLAQLRGLPPVPHGFDVRLYTDGSGYLLSIKDTIDPCRYGIFSDESGIVYEQTPRAAPLVASE